MDRVLTYPGAIPRSVDVLNTNRNAMIGDGWAAQALLGTSTLFSGLACTATGPATLTVNVAPGCVFSQQNIDNSAYSVINSDTTQQIIKVGVSLDTINFACAAPVTSGQSVVYLIEAAFVEQDAGPTVLPYYNAANPASPWAGPNNTGVSQNTVRQNICNILAKAGTPATTGTQTIPAPDAGYTGLWAVTVAQGQTTITSGDIAQISGAPFISETLLQKISQATGDARYAQVTSVQNNALAFGSDTSGAANTLTVALSPAPADLVQGMLVCVTVANTNTGASNLVLNTLSSKAINVNGGSLVGGEMRADHNYVFSYNGTAWDLISASSNTNAHTVLTGNANYYVAPSSASPAGSDSNNGSSGAPWLTLQHAYNTIKKTVDTAGFGVTINCADTGGSPYTAGLVATGSLIGGGTLTIVGNTGAPANCVVSTISTNCFYADSNAVFFLGGFKVETTTSGSGVFANQAGGIFINGPMEYGACAGNHICTNGPGAFVLESANSTISGGALSHWTAQTGSSSINCSGNTKTLTGTPNFSVAFASANLNCTLQVLGNTFVGSATGQRYEADTNGVINTNGAGPTYLPGNSGGVATTGLYV